jgi:DNA-binding response OmpR family regulator
VLDEFKAFDTDLVLMDVYLSYLNGHAWTHQIRQISNVPVIFLSSADDTSNMLTAFGQGADDYIFKPFELSVLAAKIKAMLIVPMILAHRLVSLKKESCAMMCKAISKRTKSRVLH